jgi:hypothetical protein
LTLGYSIVVIHFEQKNGCSTFWCQGFDYHTIQSKVFIPTVTPRPKKKRWLACLRISPCDMTTLKPVAIRAAQGQIIQNSLSTLRKWNNVFNVKPAVTIIFSREAVFAATACAFLNQAT